MALVPDADGSILIKTIDDVYELALHAVNESDIDWLTHRSFKKEELTKSVTRSVLFMTGFPKTEQELKLIISLIYLTVENTVLWHESLLP